MKEIKKKVQRSRKYDFILKTAEKVIKSAIRFLAFVSTVIVVYILTFALLARVFCSEHWSYIIAIFPAFLSGAAVLWRCEK